MTGQLPSYLKPRPGWAGVFLMGYSHSPGHQRSWYEGPPQDGDKPQSGPAPDIEEAHARVGPH